MKRLIIAAIFSGATLSAQAQQATPEIQAASQMLQQAQAQEFALRVEMAKLRAENDKLKADAASKVEKP